MSAHVLNLLNELRKSNNSIVDSIDRLDSISCFLQ